ncbi:unnamed protein product [Didymodactylos carnosus]|uniref:Uncharacterized protein n=1 Tax=Didymodactylos carnosus TaxID=1234261 RepID=A0A8S2EMC7_9BILA|nr:unnamed protein product [Didymodactylos carnosus]CAF4068505.1 unnamed protein product [Didymodactylos carnosus]
MVAFPPFISLDSKETFVKANFVDPDIDIVEGLPSSSDHDTSSSSLNADIHIEYESAILLLQETVVSKTNQKEEQEDSNNADNETCLEELPRSSSYYIPKLIALCGSLYCNTSKECHFSDEQLDLSHLPFSFVEIITDLIVPIQANYAMIDDSNKVVKTKIIYSTGIRITPLHVITTEHGVSQTHVGEKDGVEYTIVDYKVVIHNKSFIFTKKSKNLQKSVSFNYFHETSLDLALLESKHFISGSCFMVPIISNVQDFNIYENTMYPAKLIAADTYFPKEKKYEEEKESWHPPYGVMKAFYSVGGPYISCGALVEPCEQSVAISTLATNTRQLAKSGKKKKNMIFDVKRHVICSQNRNSGGAIVLDPLDWITKSNFGNGDGNNCQYNNETIRQCHEVFRFIGVHIGGGGRKSGIDVTKDYKIIHGRKRGTIMNIKPNAYLPVDCTAFIYLYTLAIQDLLNMPDVPLKALFNEWDLASIRTYISHLSTIVSGIDYCPDLIKEIVASINLRIK